MTVGWKQEKPQRMLPTEDDFGWQTRRTEILKSNKKLFYGSIDNWVSAALHQLLKNMLNELVLPGYRLSTYDYNIFRNEKKTDTAAAILDFWP